MDNQTLIDSLLAIRLALRGNLRSADELTSKLSGPRPIPEGKKATEVESVQALVQDIKELAACLGKSLEDHHAFLGSIPPAGANAAAPGQIRRA